jgi:hypothetical protein
VAAYYNTKHTVTLLNERMNERRRAMMGMRASSFVKTESRAASYVRELAVFFHASIVVTTYSRELLLGTDSKAKGLSLSLLFLPKRPPCHAMPPWKPFKKKTSLSASLTAAQQQRERERIKRISMSITQGGGTFAFHITRL